jgi:peptidoglycan/xylan/chitin deacetylase (PgdA/CDA1 family)
MKWLRNLVFKTLYRLGVGHVLLSRNRKKKKIPVLVFHKVIPEYDGIWPGIHPKLFEEIMLLIKKYYTILPLDYLHSRPEMNFERACFITFDDGYKDYLDYAYPILKKHNIHSTLFVLPYSISNLGHIWTSTIIYLVKHYSFPEIRAFFGTQKQEIDYSASFSDFQLNLAITKHLCDLRQVERQKIIEALRSKFKTDNKTIENELMSFEDLRKLDPQYTSIASHSLRHPSFQLETDEDFIEYEISQSKDIIEQELQVNVSSFAFPFSKFNELSLNMVKKYYSLCFTAINDFIDLKRLARDKEYIYELPRFNIHHDSAEEVFLLINGFHKNISSRSS